MDLFSLSAKLTLDISDFMAKIDQAQRAMDDFGKTTQTTTDDAVDESKGLRKVLDVIEKIGDAMYNTGAKMERFGGAVQQVFAPLTSFGQDAIDTAIEYESAFTGVKKTTKATEEEYEMLDKGIRTLSTTTASSKTDIAGVAEVVGQLTDRIEDVLPLTETAVMLGDTTTMKAGDAGTMLTRLMNIMGDGGEKAKAYGSTLVELGNNMATDEKSIMEMSLRIAGAGTTLGMTGDKVLALAAGLSSLGIKSQAGGSSISRVLLSMGEAANTGLGPMNDLTEKTGMSMRELEMLMENSPTDFKKLADSIGMTNTEMRNIVKGGVHLQDFAEISGMTMEEFSKTMEEDAYGALLAFLGGLGNLDDESATVYSTLQGLDLNTIRVRDSLLRGAAGYEQMTNAAEMASRAFEKQKALEEEANLRYGTTESKVHQMKETFSNLTLEVGEKLLPTIEKLLGYAAKVIDFLDTLPDGMLETIATIGLVAGAVGGLISTIGGIVKAGGLIVSLLTSLGPTGLIIGAVVAGVALLIANWDKVTEMWHTFVAAVQDRIELLKEGWVEFVDYWVDVGHSIADFFTDLWNTIADFWEKVGSWIENAVTAVGNWLAPIGQLFEKAWGAAKTAVTKQLDDMKSAYDSHENKVEGVLAAGWEFITSGYDAVWTFIDELTGGKLTELAGKIGDWISNAIRKISDFFTNLQNKVKSGLDTVKNKVSEIISSIKTTFENFLKLPIEWGRRLIDGFISGITEKWNALKTTVTNVVDNVKNWWTGAHGLDTHSPSRWAEKVFENVMEGGVKGLQDGLPGMLRAAGNITSDVKDALSLTPAYAYASPSVAAMREPAWSAARGNRDSAMLTELRETLNALRGMKVVMDTGETVGVLTSPMNSSLGQQYVYATRGIA